MRRFRGLLVARLGARWNFRQQSTHAHPRDLLSPNGKNRSDAPEHKIDSVELWRTRASRKSDDRRLADASHQEQIARVDWHSEMIDLPPGFDDCCRNNVSPVSDRACAKHEDRIRAGANSVLDGSGERCGLVRCTSFEDDIRP